MVTATTNSASSWMITGDFCNNPNKKFHEYLTESPRFVYDTAILKTVKARNLLDIQDESLEIINFIAKRFILYLMISIFFLQCRHWLQSLMNNGLKECRLI